jgi:hypothetical protein
MAAPAPATPTTSTADFKIFEDFAVRIGLLRLRDGIDFPDRRGAFKAGPSLSYGARERTSTRPPADLREPVGQHPDLVIYRGIVTTYRNTKGSMADIGQARQARETIPHLA